MTPRLHEIYNNEIVPSMTSEFNYSNRLEVPRLEKIVINMGVGEASQDKKKMDGALADLTAIAGQKPIVTYAKKSIAGFKLREEMMVGCKVTMRRTRMFEFSGSSRDDYFATRPRFSAVLMARALMAMVTMPWASKEQIVFPEV